MGPAETLLVPFVQAGFAIIFAFLAVVGLIMVVRYGGNGQPYYQCRGCGTTFFTQVSNPVCPVCQKQKLYLVNLVRNGD